jgi:DNA-directed RNA polymerase subunit K/omega
MLKPAQDLISLPIEMNDKIADTKFRLVHIASQRVRQLTAGANPTVMSRSIKDTTVALEEAVAHSFKIVVGEEAIRAKQEERAKLDEQLSAKEEEIRKELSAYLSESQEEEGEEELAGEEPAAAEAAGEDAEEPEEEATEE